MAAALHNMGAPCDCVPSMLYLYIQLEAETKARPLLDTLLCLIDQTCMGCAKFIECGPCSKDPLCLAVISALSCRLVEAANAHCHTTNASEPRKRHNTVYLDDYELKGAESTLIVACLLQSRIQSLDKAILAPVRGFVDGLAQESCDASTRQMLAACKSALGETTEALNCMTMTLQMQLREEQNGMVD